MTSPSSPVYTLQEMLRQAGMLADDLRALHGLALAQVRDLLSGSAGVRASRVYLTGSGDSYHAALATQMAFHTLAGLPCEPLSVLPMLNYGPFVQEAKALSRDTLVIGVSASGGNQRAIQVLERAREHGAHTVAVTSTAHSRLAKAADGTLVLPLPGLRPCPGMRTYQASLLGLLMMAIELGRLGGARTAREGGLEREVLATADAVEATAATVERRCEQLADRIAQAPVTMMIGSGPSYGTAMFAAAKLIETAGVFAAGQDLEEWEHVEVLARPCDMPTFVIAASGRSHARALEAAARASGYGRTVIAVAEDGDTALTEHAEVVLPLRGAVREELSPLLTHLFAGYLACFVARRLDRLPFATNSL